MWLLAGLLWIALVVGIYWSYKNRKAKRDAAREQKFQKMFSALAPAPASGRAPAAVEEAVRLVKKPRLFGPQTTLIYYVLRSGLPDHEIFVDVPLDSLIESPSPGYHAGQMSKRLAAARVDFVVCDKQMAIVAAVLLDGSPAVEAATIEDLLSAGIRLVRIDAVAPPKHSQVRALIYGGV
ncbi:MAG TPA: DUF2726 domain-containing protein [Burkholderiales bacterium]|nr:DUF2726 domain-containing protein [Burkholderiales bacterium]